MAARLLSYAARTRCNQRHAHHRHLHPANCERRGAQYATRICAALSAVLSAASTAEIARADNACPPRARAGKARARPELRRAARALIMRLYAALLLAFACLARAQLPEPKTELVRNSSKSVGIRRVLKANEKERVRLRLRLDTDFRHVQIQWQSDDNERDERIALAAKLIDEGEPFPDEHLSVRFEGNSKRKPFRKCSKKYPCIDGKPADERSFFTAWGTAFVRVKTESRNADIALIVEWKPQDDTANRGKILPGKIRVRVSEKSRCGSRLSGRQCEGGACKNGECSCVNGSRGRFCEVTKDRVFQWSNLIKKRSCEGDRKEEHSLIVKKNRWHYVEYTPCPGSKGRAEDRVELTVSKPNFVTVVAKKKGQVCNTEVLKTGEMLPSMYDSVGICKANKKPDSITIHSEKLKESDTWIIGLLPNASELEKNGGNLTLKLKISGCNLGSNGQCVPPGRPPSNMYAFLILPICLCILCIAAAIVCILLYFDRRHGFVTGPDKLSRKELHLMCPEYQLAGPPLEQPDHAEHVACNICISDFQPGDRLRKLRCDHRFHCDCVDPWLTEANASCPTCRQEARVDELSERRIQRALVKHVLAPMLRIPQRTRRNRLAGLSSFRRSGSLTDLAGARAALARARGEDASHTPSERAFSERHASDPGNSAVFGSDGVPPAPTPPQPNSAHAIPDRKQVQLRVPSERADSALCSDIACSDDVPHAPTPPQPFPPPMPDRLRTASTRLLSGHRIPRDASVVTTAALPAAYDPADDDVPPAPMPPPPQPPVHDRTPTSPHSASSLTSGARSRSTSPARASSATTTSVASATTAARNVSEFSDTSFYTAPLNFDFKPLNDHGVLPHVRAGLVPPRNAPTVRRAGDSGDGQLAALDHVDDESDDGDRVVPRAKRR